MVRHWFGEPAGRQTLAGSNPVPSAWKFYVLKVHINFYFSGMWREADLPNCALAAMPSGNSSNPVPSAFVIIN